MAYSFLSLKAYSKAFEAIEAISGLGSLMFKNQKKNNFLKTVFKEDLAFSTINFKIWLMARRFLLLEGSWVDRLL